MIAIENQFVKVTVIADQGADIYEMRYKPLDLDVLWHAPQELLPIGLNIQTKQREQGNFLDYLHGGWQEVLPNGHLDCVYKGAALGQHGEVSVLPWSVRVLKDEPEEVSISFRVRTRRTPFMLERVMTLRRDDCKLVLDETVINEGQEEMDFMWGHHPTFGAPFLEEGCEIIFPENTRVHIPSNNNDARCRFKVDAESDWPEVASPDGTVIRADLVLDAAAATNDSLYMEVQEGWYTLRNKKIGLEIQMTWDTAVFPYVWCWQVYGGAYGYPYYGRTYNLAIEPFTSPIATLTENVQAGKSYKLAAGQSLSTQLTFELCPVKGD
ncbi:unnamed protein product [Aphanomyces euteiches]